MTTERAARGQVEARLLVLTSTYPRWAGDTEPAFVHELARRLTNRFDVTVLCPHAPGAAARERMDGVEVVRFRYAPARWETLVNDGGIVNNLRARRWKWLLVPVFLAAQALATWRLLRRARPDVVHAHWLVPQGAVMALLGALRIARVPWLVTSHGADLFALRAPPMRAVKRWVLRRAAAATVVSTPMLEELVRLGAAPARVAVQPMGVDLRARFSPDPAVTRARDEILFVGRLVEKKGLRHLIDAFALLAPRHRDLRLTVAGSGPELEPLREQARALGIESRVRFLGAVAQADLPALYRRATLFAAPFVVARGGDQEGLGLVVVEALGCGCPVLATDLPPLRDIPSPALTLVPGPDPESLAAAIERRLSATGAATEDDRAALVEKHDWSAAAKAYETLLLELAQPVARVSG